MAGYDGKWWRWKSMALVSRRVVAESDWECEKNIWEKSKRDVSLLQKAENGEKWRKQIHDCFWFFENKKIQLIIEWKHLSIFGKENDELFLMKKLTE